MPIVRLLSIEVHAISDAIYFALIILLAIILDYSGQALSSAYCGALAASGIALYLISGAPLGFFPLLPLRWHSLIEYAAAPLTMVLPPLLFADSMLASWALPILGAVNLVVNALSDYPIESELASA